MELYVVYPTEDLVATSLGIIGFSTRQTVKGKECRLQTSPSIMEQRSQNCSLMNPSKLISKLVCAGISMVSKASILKLVRYGCLTCEGF